MSDIDRVFARLGGRQTASGDQREVRSIPRKGGATGSRVVEVVRLPSRDAGTGKQQLQRPGPVRSQTWDDGFPARSAPPRFTEPPRLAEEAPVPMAHVMPMWERATNDEAAAPPAPAENPPAEIRQPAARPSAGKARASRRRVADPFDAEDDGANCLRCGYVVEAARERRGLMTCAACG
jgi:hypothetical protein